ncbi:hypothetical protein JXB28_04320 [Candidatus Woesearchaeota archaeon]|nr:hypothetical protein [Candidatus Woesearchaeota archaeon]
MKKSIIFLLLATILILGCSKSFDKIPAKDDLISVTVYDLMLNNGNKYNEPPYAIEDKYNGKEVYLTAKIAETVLCSGPSLGCKENNCSADCSVTAMLYDDRLPWPPNIGASKLDITFKGQRIGYFKNKGEALKSISCGTILEENKYYTFKGIANLTWYYAPDPAKLKLYWYGSFEIEDCQETEFVL